MYCRLHEYLAEIFGKSFRCLPEELTGHGSPLLADFELELNTKFDGKNLQRNRRFKLKMGNDFQHEKYDTIYKSVILTGYEIKDIMDGPLHYIKSILDNQISAAAKRDHGKVEVSGRLSSVMVELTCVRRLCFVVVELPSHTTANKSKHSAKPTLQVRSCCYSRRILFLASVLEQ